eukprot:4516715-Pyramimonas_sp.AAC.1
MGRSVSQQRSWHQELSRAASVTGIPRGICKSLLKFNPTAPLNIAGRVPFRFSSFMGPCQQPVMFFLPARGMSRASRIPWHSTTARSISHDVRGMKLLHCVMSSFF